MELTKQTEVEWLREKNQELQKHISQLRQDMLKMKYDPTYFASGRYKFTTAYKDRCFTVEIDNGDIRLIENHKDYNVILEQVEL